MSRWRALLDGPPGERFMRYHERAERHSTRLSAIGGVLLVLLGLLLSLTPGPGFIFVLLGAAMLAARSRAVAGALDRCETRLRGWLR